MAQAYWCSGLIGLLCFCECIYAAPPPAFWRVSLGTCNLALLMEACRVECGVHNTAKNPVVISQCNLALIPPTASVGFIHPSFDNGLYGFHGAMNNEVILPPTRFVVSRYFVKQYTGHIFCLKVMWEFYFSSMVLVVFMASSILLTI